MIEPYALYPSVDSINVRWMSASPSRGCVTLWETASGPGASQAVTVAEEAPAQFHNVRVRGLKPFTSYSYRVSPKGREHSFRTAATPDVKSFRFVVFGDPQGHGQLRETMAVAAAANADFAIGLGDFVGAAFDEAYIQYFEKSRELLRATALCPTPGNHDYRHHCRPFEHDNDMLTYDRHLGNGDGNNYFFDYGKFRFVMLNYPDANTVKPDTASGEWLVGQLRAARRLGKKVLLFHHCPCFTSTTIDWAVDASLIPPLAEEFRDIMLIDFGAHIHTYEKSFYPDASGVCFITTGGAGELYEYPVNQCPNKYQHAAIDACHVCVVEATPSTLRVEAVGLGGEILDCSVLEIER